MGNECVERLLGTVAHASDLGGRCEFGVGAESFRVAPIEADDAGKHHAYGLAVDDAVVRCEGVRGGMSGAKHAVLDGQAGKRSAELHAAAGFQVVGIGKDAREVWQGELETFVRVHQRKGSTLFGDRCLDNVSDGVDASAGSDARWL